MTMSSITSVLAREILDSRGYPTVEADVLVGDICGRAAVPSGASTGSHEAWERRDGDAGRFGGKGVLKAVDAVKTILQPALIGEDVLDQAALDHKLLRLDGSSNKENLGANAVLAVSLAAAVARAKVLRQPLYRSLRAADHYTMPIPMMNVLNGGAHADNPLDVQEIMIAPLRAPTFTEAVRCGAEVFHALKARLKKQGYATNVGDEGGFAPAVPSLRAALDCVVAAIHDAGYRLGETVGLALDVAATEFYREGQYTMRGEGLTLTSGQLVEFYTQLCRDYPLFSIEDAMAEDDWDGWAALTQRLGSTVQLVGDDLFVTNRERLQRGMDLGVANAILIKMNQIGSLTETIDVMDHAAAHGYARIVSHRSGETEDTFLADLAVAMGSEFIKTGSLSRSERVAKYNRLMRIEHELGAAASYRGSQGLPNRG